MGRPEGEPVLFEDIKYALRTANGERRTANGERRISLCLVKDRANRDGSLTLWVNAKPTRLSCYNGPFVYIATMKTGFDLKIQEAVDDPNAMRAIVKEGLEIGWFDDLAKLFGASGTAFAAIVGIDPRTLTRRRREGRLTLRESNALYHLAVLYEHALDVLGDSDSVRNWFNTPEPDFSGMSPLALLDTAPGIKEVDHLLGRIEHGVF